MSRFGRRRGMGGYPRRRRPTRRMRPAFGQRSGMKMRMIIGLAIAGFAVISYFKSGEYNPATNQTIRVNLSPSQEIKMGLQAAPQMVQQHGGLYPDQQMQDLVDRIGHALVNNSNAKDTNWNYEFHLLADPNTINAFALPGGQIFITYALYSQFETEGQLAGVLGHEIGHVVARHSAQRMAKHGLTKGLIGAVIAASGSHQTGQMAQMVGQMVNMKYGRGDELESDALGIQYMAEAGYDPRSMVGVMEILAQAGGGKAQPEFFSTHPNPENRVQKIEQNIQRLFPNGVPADLTP